MVAVCLEEIANDPFSLYLATIPNEDNGLVRRFFLDLLACHWLEHELIDAFARKMHLQMVLV
jgi:hypothetical protein